MKFKNFLKRRKKQHIQKINLNKKRLVKKTTVNIKR